MRALQPYDQGGQSLANEATQSQHNHLSAAKAEVEALASKAYMDALLEDAKAAGRYEQLRALREANAATIEAWRTESSNMRSVKL